jgi:protein-S-isoprenylcysteine O-methyltransferase Ste14
MKRRLSSALASALFLVISPGTVAGYVPWLLSGWHVEPPLLGWPWLRGFGVLLLAAGLPVLLDSFARFALVGQGTPAPVMPTDRLVVSGLYRYVRNPIYLAVLAIIVGQGLLFGSAGVLVWAGVVAARGRPVPASPVFGVVHGSDTYSLAIQITNATTASERPTPNHQSMSREYSLIPESVHGRPRRGGRRL